jgi:hypothetical protein
VCTGVDCWFLGGFAYAEKSAAAVAEMAASAESLACHTAPLWPRNVPILELVLVCWLCSLGLVVVPVSRYAIAEHGVVVCG